MCERLELTSFPKLYLLLLFSDYYYLKLYLIPNKGPWLYNACTLEKLLSTFLWLQPPTGKLPSRAPSPLPTHVVPPAGPPVFALNSDLHNFHLWRPWPRGSQTCLHWEKLPFKVDHSITRYVYVMSKRNEIAFMYSNYRRKERKIQLNQCLLAFGLSRGSQKYICHVDNFYLARAIELLATTGLTTI